MKKEVSLVLCQGRHEIIDNNGIKIEKSIFENEVNPLDVDGLEKQASDFLIDNYLELGTETTINLYVTGLTVASTSVINAINKINVSVSIYNKFINPNEDRTRFNLVLWHYNRDSGNYYKQEMWL